MKIVHLNTSNKGGAGIAALRLHEQLLKTGVDSKFLTLHRFPSEIPEQFQFHRGELADFSDRVLKKLKLREPYPKALEVKHTQGRPTGFELFSLPYSKFRLDQHPLVQQADIVHLNWVNDGFLDYASFFSHTNKRIVWTLHDMNPFTGGCHHADGCMKFTSACEVCPQLERTIDPSYSNTVFGVKRSGLAKVADHQMQIVSPSSWLRTLSEQSTLFHRFKHTTIPNVMNEKRFASRNKSEVRRKLSIPDDKKLILFVAHNLSNTRKGGAYLLEALKLLGNDAQIMLCSVGAESDSVNYPLPHAAFGYVNEEERMADLYAAADVFVLPSLAENFPNTICESLLCGTPVVAFNVGGIPELINEKNGKLADPFDITHLAEAIQFVLRHHDKYQPAQISESAHDKLNSELNTNRYIAVYSDLLKGHA